MAESQDKCFRASDWTCIVDMEHCPVSKEQVATFRGMRDRNELAALDVIDCSSHANARLPICNEIKAFPAMCNSQLGKCVYGMRESIADLEKACEEVRTATSG